MRGAFSFLLLAMVLTSPGSLADDQQPDGIRFYAYDWARDGTVVDRAGVTCAILRADGMDVVGRTDAKGEILVPNDRLSAEGNLAIFFCPGPLEIQCAAIRLAGWSFEGYGEYNVRVTGPEIIDRIPVEIPER